jgi:hypothetical protein
MASPTGVTMPAFEVAEGQVFVLKKGTQVIGQVSRINPRSQTPSRKIARIGDTTKKTSLSPTESNVSMELYHEMDPNDLGALLGVPKPGSGGWVGTEEIRLNNTVAPYDLTIEVYDGAVGTGDVLQGKWTLDNFRPASMNVNIQADAAATVTVDGEVDDIYYTPEDGVGA